MRLTLSVHADTCSSTFIALMQTVLAILHHQGQKCKLVCVSFPGLALVLDLAPGPGPVGAVIVLALAAAATAGTSPQTSGCFLFSIFWCFVHQTKCI